MKTQIPEALGLIAGKGDYPLMLARSAKQQGVRRLVVIAFTKETDPAIAEYADEIKWLPLGQLQQMLDVLRDSGVKHAVMAGQLTPTALFRVRLDSRALALIKRLRERNAETIFGAAADELKGIGIELLPAHLFMESCMTAPGQLTSRAPTAREQADIELGMRVAKIVSDLDIGQTVVVKEGTILAVEAFEGTDEAIKRAGLLGGPGSVVVKVAKRSHDMRFDIPVIGPHTIKLLRKTGAAVLAIEAGRSILLEREQVIKEADRLGISLIAVKA